MNLIRNSVFVPNPVSIGRLARAAMTDSPPSLPEERYESAPLTSERELQRTADRQGWVEWQQSGYPDQRNFQRAGEVTYLYPGGLVTGTIEFESPALAKFKVRTADGQTVEGNSNYLGGSEGRLWISDKKTLDKLEEHRQAHAALEEWLQARDDNAVSAPLPAPAPKPDFSSLEARASRENWMAYSVEDHGPDRPPFITGARVAYAYMGANGALEVVEGSASFKGPWQSGFDVRGQDGRTATGNTNDVAGGQARLWLID